MQAVPQNQPRECLEIPARPLGAGAMKVVNRVSQRNYSSGSSAFRSRLTCTCSARPGSTRCAKHGYVVPSDKLMRRNSGSQEILRRALARPNRRLSLRWWNFKPTPSRLSNMSVAS